MDYFNFQGFSPTQRDAFNDFIASQRDAFPKQTVFDLGGGQKLGFHINQPSQGFYAANGGDLVLTREKGQPNLRVRVSPQWSGDSQRWRYLKLGEPYRFEVEFDLRSRNDGFKGVSWANLFELWGPFDGKDTGRNPAFEIMLRGKSGLWEVRQRGDARRHHDRDYEFIKTETYPFNAGHNKFVVETLLSLDGSGYTVVTINDEEVMCLAGVTNTYYSEPYGDGEPLGGMINFPEIYCPNSCVESEPIVMEVFSFSASDGHEEPDDPEPVPVPLPVPAPDPRIEELAERVGKIEATLQGIRDALG